MHKCADKVENVLDYPSIALSTGQKFREFEAHVFDKLDGRQIRVQWSKKKGWHLYGSKTRLFDASDKEYARAIPLFEHGLAEPLAKVAVDNKWPTCVAVCEYWSNKSLGGLLLPDDEMKVSLIDLGTKDGFVDPKEYVRMLFKLYIPAATYLGPYKWTRGFVEDVWQGQWAHADFVTFEGVVGKSSSRRDGLIMAKAKQRIWVDRIRASYAPDEAQKLINS